MKYNCYVFKLITIVLTKKDLTFESINTVNKLQNSDLKKKIELEKMSLMINTDDTEDKYTSH